MFTQPAFVPAGLAGAKQWMLVVLAGLVGLGVLLWWLFGLGSGSASAQTAATNFAPSVKITVPQTDADGNGANDLSGTRFDVGFSPAEGSVAGCTTTASGAYVVQDSGTVEVSGTAPSLVDRPAGETARCSYVIGWPNVDGLKLRAGATADVSATTPVDSVSQTMVKATYDAAFTPAITVSVPDLDENDDDNNDFAGTAVRISYRSRSGAGCSYGAERYVIGNDGNNDYSGTILWVSYGGSPESCSRNVFEKYIVGDDGTVSLEGTSARISDRTVGALPVELCTYRVGIQYNSANHRFGRTTDKLRIDANDSSISIYVRSYFQPSISIIVPQFDEDDDGSNDFVGRRFNVRFSRVEGSHFLCTNSRNIELIVSRTGAVTLYSYNNEIIDYVVGASSRCSYDVEYPGYSGNSSYSSFGKLLHLQSSSSAIISATSNSISAVYSEVNTLTDAYFTPTVEFLVPPFDSNNDGTNDFSNGEFWIKYSSYTPGCLSSVSEKYIVANDGTATVDGNSVRLSKRPVGMTTGSFCTYTVKIHIMNSNIFPWKLIHRSSRVDYSNASTSVSIATAFRENISISVPQIDEDGDGNNDYSSSGIRTSFTPVPGSDWSCTPYLYREISHANYSNLLVDRPGGQTTRCSYAVKFPAYVVPYYGDNARKPLYLQSNTSTVLSAENNSASAVYSATYTPSSTYFTPDATITLPVVDDDSDGNSDFSGTKLWISYSSDTPGCPDRVFEEHIIGDSGTVSVDGTAAKLDERPAGATTEIKCRYEVGIHAIDNSDLGEQLSTSVPVITSDSTSASIFVLTFFELGTSPTVPVTDVNGDGLNDYYGIMFNIQYDSMASSNEGCSSGSNSSLSIRRQMDSRRSGASSRRVRLVDRIVGETARCSYSVTWPDVDGLVLQTSVTVTASASNSLITAVYIDGFFPEVTIEVPQVDSTSTTTNDFSGTSLTVRYTPTSTSDDDCSGSSQEPIQEVYTISDDGTIAGPVTAAGLIHRPSGASAGTTCLYDVAFVNTNENLRLQSDVFSSISKSSKAVSASYDGVFSASVRINVPRRGFSNSGVSFRVRYAPKSTQEVPGTHCSGYDVADDITDVEVEDYIVGTESKVVVSGDKAVLMDRLAGSSVPCSYTVIFPATAAYEGLGLVFDDDNSDDIEDEVVVSASSKNASADYQRIRYFSPSVSIYIESDSQNSGIQPDSRIRINYTRNEDIELGNPSGACTESTWEEHTVDVDRSTERDGLAADLAEYQPGNDMNKCVYNVEVVWENMPSNLILQPGTATSTTTDSNQVLVVYTAGFSPEVAFSIPQFDGDTSGENAFSETRIIVRFKQDNSMQGNAVEKCSLSGDEEVSETYVVNANGTVGEAENEVYLVDFIWEKVSGTYAKSTVCEYTATFVSMFSGSSWDASELDLNTDVQVKFQSGGLTDSMGNLIPNSSLSANYDASFVPDVAFKIPAVNDSTTQVHRYSGADLEVSFYVDIGSNENCGDSSNRGAEGAASGVIVVNYTIQDSGAIVSNGTEPRLMHGFSGSSEKCSYSVLLPGPISSAGDSSLSLNLESLAYTSFEVGASIPATYSSMFVPGVDITLPSDGEGNSASLIGTTFVVSFSLESGSASICTNTNNVSLRYRVQAGGSVSLVSNPLSFVDGVVISSESGTTAAECTYRATIVSLPPGRLVYDGSPVIVSGNDPVPEAVFSRVT